MCLVKIGLANAAIFFGSVNLIITSMCTQQCRASNVCELRTECISLFWRSVGTHKIQLTGTEQRTWQHNAAQQMHMYWGRNRSTARRLRNDVLPCRLPSWSLRIITDLLFRSESAQLLGTPTSLSLTTPAPAKTRAQIIICSSFMFCPSGQRPSSR